MHSRRNVIISITICGLGLGCLSLLNGCGDESRTTGTQVQMSPEVKAELEDMKSVQKDERAARKAERATQKKRR